MYAKRSNTYKDNRDVELQSLSQRSSYQPVIRNESAERQRIRRIFERYDTNHDGFLERLELRSLIKERPNQCQDIPEGFCQTIRNYDVNDNGHLDFEEFFLMCKEHQWLVRDWGVKYCKFMIAPRGPKPVSIRPAMATIDQVDYADHFTESYGSEMRFCPPPLTMVLFSIIEVCFFIVDVVHFKDYEKTIHHVGTSVDGPAARLFIYNPWRRQEAWRFVSYMFVHVGVMHIVMNLIVQIFLGIALELVHNWWRVSLVYLAGVLAGSMGTSLVSPRTFLAGASGGVYALMTAHLATIIMNWKEMRYAAAHLFIFLVFIITDIGTSIDRHNNDPNDSVGYMAHLCGGIAGLLVGICALRNLEVRPFEKILWWVAVIIYAILMIAGVSIHIFYPDRFPQSSIYKNPSRSGIL